ncbi:receptor protein-tyrosine kinase [Modestobacter sp. DSM 44400]|uniref:polysaccharide biosynthesis tyrosine autokinase n=1 Tax=Modestobacter sp. DSM 44400 TaxID=1550230 RepID=UPI00089A93C0|nr:polysaccharide biosynthesis tyrosine autokinase [Modestobacter sp. DSM 44400]SDY75695.1 receptor protein-tyrosine kinase [Modestobacter sp. DSM 44400]
MELKGIAQVIRLGWWLLIVSALGGLLVAGGLTYLTTPLYSSSTKLFVSTAASADTSAAYQGNLFSQQRVASYADLLTGEQLAARVVDELGLALTPAQVAAKVQATALPDTVILRVDVTDTDAARAHDIAASLGRHFTEQVSLLETPAGGDASTVKVTTVQEADLNPAPISPDRTSNLGLGLVLGLLAGVGLAVLRIRLDNTVKTPQDVLAATGSTVIGTVLEDPELARDHLVADLDRHSLSSEAYRSIRTNLQFLDVDHPPRVIVVSSSVPSEGKSTLAVNISTVLAQSGSRVCLIEADLRRPRVTKYIGLISGAGLTNVLAGDAAFHEVAQPWGDGRLTVLAAGPMPPNPSEMLGSAQMRTLLGQLREQNDFVIIDAPPLLPVTDAAVLSVHSDGCLLSARHGHVRQAELSEAAQALARIDARLLGVVLNRVPMATGAARGYGYSYEPDPDRATLKPRAKSRGASARSHAHPQSPGTSPLRAVGSGR